MQNYTINTNIGVGQLKLIDVPQIAASVKEKWFNQSLCQVNDCVIRLGVVEGEFHWHKHDNEDELFLVVDGKLLIDLEHETIELLPKQGFLIPRGIVHRTRALERTVILMMEGSNVVPTGD